MSRNKVKFSNEKKINFHWFQFFNGCFKSCLSTYYYFSLHKNFNTTKKTQAVVKKSNNCDLAATFNTCCYNTIFKNTKQIVLAHRQYILLLRYTWVLCCAVHSTQSSWQTASWSVYTCIRIHTIIALYDAYRVPVL